jgi:hypothetical protein
LEEILLHLEGFGKAGMFDLSYYSFFCMKKISNCFLSIIMMSCSCFFQGCSTPQEEQNLRDPQNGIVQDSETAKKIAEAIWTPIYGKSIVDEKPYKATLIGDSIWIVESSSLKEQFGGVAYIEIRKSDCKVVKVFHGK